MTSALLVLAGVWVGIGLGCWGVCVRESGFGLLGYAYDAKMLAIMVVLGPLAWAGFGREGA